MSEMENGQSCEMAALQEILDNTQGSKGESSVEEKFGEVTKFSDNYLARCEGKFWYIIN